MLCYCKSNKPFDVCCKPIIEGSFNANTAEELMRSRYTAYAIGNVDYLLKSHYITTRPTKERNSILLWTKSVIWVGLAIVSKSKGMANDTHGYVEFKATYLENGVIQCIHENSYFKKEKGEWFYVDGVHN